MSSSTKSSFLGMRLQGEGWVAQISLGTEKSKEIYQYKVRLKHPGWSNSKHKKKRNLQYFVNQLPWTLFLNSVLPQSPFACMHNRCRMLIKQHGTGANPLGSCFVNSCFQVALSSLMERSGRACALQMGYPLQLLAASGTRGLDFPFVSQPGAAVAFCGLIQTSWLNTHGQSKSFTGPGPLQQDQCWSQRICYPL